MAFLAPTFRIRHESRQRPLVCTATQQSSGGMSEREAKQSERLERKLLEGGRVSPTNLHWRLVAASRRGDVEAAEKWAKWMRERRFRMGIASYTSLISVHRRMRNPQRCIELLKTLVQEGETPTEPVTYECIRAVTEAQDVKEAREVIGLILRSSGTVSVSSWNAYLKLLVDAGFMKEAVETITSMQELLTNPDVISYNTLMTGFLNKRDHNSALALFGMLLVQVESDNAIIPDTGTFQAVFQALQLHPEAKHRPDRTRRALKWMARFQVSFNVKSATAFLPLARRAGLEHLQKTVGIMLDSPEVKPDMVFNGQAMRELSRLGDYETCRRMLDGFIVDKLPVEVVHFNSVLQACSHTKTGSEANAEEVLKLMDDSGIAPDAFSFCALLSSKFRRPYSEVVEILEEATRRQIPISRQLQSAAVACTYDAVSEAEDVFRHLRSIIKSSRPSFNCYLAFLQVCGTAGRSDMAVRICYAMQKQGFNPDRQCYQSFVNGMRLEHFTPKQMQPYFFLLKTICKIVDDLEDSLPVTKIRIRF